MCSLKTNVVSFDQHVPPSLKKLCCLNHKMYSLHTDYSIIKWDIKHSFVPECSISCMHDELSCLLCIEEFESSDDEVSEKEKKKRQEFVLIGSGSGQVYLANFTARRLDVVEKTFGGTVLDIQKCSPRLVAIACQDKIVRLFEIEINWSTVELSNQTAPPPHSSVNFNLVTTLRGSQQSPVAIFGLSCMSNMLVAGAVNVLLVARWKHLKHTSKDPLTDQTCTVDYCSVPKYIHSQKKALKDRRRSVLDVGGHQDVSVRCVVLVDESTCVSGDNFGRLMWWDLNTGTVMQTVKSHNAAITTIVLAQSPLRIVTSGVDPSVVVFQKIDPNSEVWEQVCVFKSVVSEVTSMQYVYSDWNPGRLVIGSKSPILFYWWFQPDKWRITIPFLKQFNCQVLTDSRQILILHPSYLSIHSLGVLNDNIPSDQIEPNKPLKLEANCKKQFVLKAPDCHNIVCAAASCDGMWISYASHKMGTYFLKLFQVNEDLTIAKVPLRSRFSDAIVSTLFLNLSKYLMCCFFNGTLLRYDLVHGGKPDFFTLNTKGVCDVQYSNVHDLLAVANDLNLVNIYNCSDKFSFICQLPVRNALPASMKFSCHKKFICVQYSDYIIVEFDVDHQKYSKWSQIDQDTYKDVSLSTPSIGNSLNYVLNDSRVLFHAVMSLNSLNPDLVGKKDSRKRKMKAVAANEKDRTGKEAIRVNNNFKFIRNCAAINDDEIVLFVVQFNDLYNNVAPASYSRKIFGS